MTIKEVTKFPELYTKFRNFVEGSLLILLSAPDKHLMRKQSRYKVKFNGDGVNISTIEECPVSPISHAKMEEIEKSNEQLEAKEELKKYVKFPWEHSTSPRRFLEKVIAKTDCYVFDEDVFNQMYKDYEEFLLTNNSQHQSVIYLENFEIDSMIFELDNDIYIRKLNEVEFAEMLDSTHMSLAMPNRMSLRHSIQVNYWFKENPDLYDGIKDREIRELLTNIIYAMRLFKTGNISGAHYNTRPLEWSFLDGSMSFGRLLTVSKPGGNKYLLKDQEKDQFKEFWEKYKALLPFPKSLPFLDIAINRFNSAYSNEKPEDRLIDFMISFEALYLTGKDDELSYRLALRTAYCLFDICGDRKKIFEDIRDAYSLRSKIVHGKDHSKLLGKILKIYKSLDDFILQIEEYLRVSIRKYIDYAQQSFDQDKIIHELDEKILS